jgi:hypothetical protein
MSKENPEITRVRAAAASYAKTFLANKYNDEYSELYRAYLTNRGVPVRHSAGIIDEREAVRIPNEEGQS